MHRDFIQWIENNLPYGNLTKYSRIFNNEFNISFFSPKKDQYKLCLAYRNAENAEKCTLKEDYNIHLREKEPSREERRKENL